MIVHRIHAAPPPDMARALAAFEEQFRYPLGPGRTFRISHGDDYPRFFRAMGEGGSFVAMHGESVIGTLGAAIRRVTLPGASVQQAAYFGDLKVAPVAGRGRAVIALLRAAREWAAPRVGAAFSVVMDGTAVTPDDYSGRLGIPSFEPLGHVVVFQLRTVSGPAGANLPRASPASGLACHEPLRAGRWTLCDGNPAERSEFPPQWLMLPDGSACGLVEDTLKAKRLFADDGSEIRSGHLSCLAYQDVRSATELTKAALRVTAERGFTALFVAIPRSEAAAFAGFLPDPPLVAAPATVFGSGMATCALWHVNTAEI